jgi:hypothetical protein
VKFKASRQCRPDVPDIKTLCDPCWELIQGPSEQEIRTTLALGEYIKVFKRCFFPVETQDRVVGVVKVSHTDTAPPGTGSLRII